MGTESIVSRQTSGRAILKLIEGYLPRDERGVADRRIASDMLDIICFMTVDKFGAIWPEERAFGITSRYVPLRDALLYSKAPIVTALAGMLRDTKGFSSGQYDSPEDMAITMLEDFIDHFKRYCDGYRKYQREHAVDEAVEDEIEAVF